MLLDKIKINSKLPFASNYETQKDERSFLKLSYEANGAEYTMGSCPDGYIIPKFNCEEFEDWNTRRKLTPTRSYVSSVINKYNASIFRNEPIRATESATFDLLYKDADGYGNSLNKVMRDALKVSQIEGACYLLADSTATDTEILTIAQQQSSGVRPYIRVVKPDSVANATKVEDKLLEVIIMLEDSEGKMFARYMNDMDYVDIALGDNFIVTAISDAYSHGYSKLPLACIDAFQDAQAKPISYSQKTIVNLLSLLHQEMNDHTFTKHILSGVRVPENDQGTQKINYGSKRLIVLEDANASLTTIGSDVTQADSLRAQVKLEEDNLYYSAGFGNQNVEPTNMSGFALSILKDDFFINCEGLSKAAEGAENTVMELIAEKDSMNYVPAIYSSRFIADSTGEALNALRDLLALPLPQSFKNIAIKNYIETFYNISNEQKSIIEQELINSTQPE